MHGNLVKTATLVAALALSAATYSQGRHDEKPHGSAKPAAETTDKAPATGGRHDSGSTTHAPAKKAPAKKDKAADQKGADQKSRTK